MPPVLDDDQEWVELWLTLQVDEKFEIYYQRKEVEMLRRPHREGSPAGGSERRGPVGMGFFGALALLHLHERRYRVDEQILEEVRRLDEAAWGPDAGPWGSCAPSAHRFSHRVAPGLGPYLARRFL